MEQLKLRVRNGICICFTAQGKETATRLLEKLSQQMEEAFDFLDYTGSEHSKPLKQVVKEAFQEKEAILFVGAAGIAVRLIAPWVQDKLKDPAVLVIDEQGRYAIPILSGHVGGCNELAEAAAQILGAEPVITTATDLRQAFAVDVFAAENELVISDRELAKQISAAELRGEKIGFFSDYPVDGIVPAEITPGVWQKENIYVTLKQGGCPKNAPASLVRRDMVIGLQEKKEQRDAAKAAAVVAVETGDSGKAAEIDMSVGKSDIGSLGQKSEQKKEQSYEPENESGTPELLRLYPRTVVLGMGCRRDSSLNAVREMARVALSRAMIDKSAVRAIATVDRKKNEMAFLALAKEWDVELWSFTPEELESAGTKFAESPFVRKTVGVGNVCERAAVMGVRRIYREREMDEKNLPAIDLRVQKMAFNGVTAAVAVPASEQVRRQQWKKKNYT
ncbi:MAG: cobalamin biosynthesis protein [Clostridium sp.]|mgnify:FL=1|uniref:cobalt-precorrin 5A hydrolase n=1 Tax=Clostridium sp. TaxID=1506 RepID=UPI002E75FAB1|nr:cobalamin biosynthesis protein [Clostridium sp.]MEE0129972.1 cobalamin biosynthesis protein [Clostridium sp.]